jgi:hypothetical protein
VAWLCLLSKGKSNTMVVQKLFAVVLNNQIPSVFLFLIAIVSYLFIRHSHKQTIYEQFKQVDNPWWKPRILGKGPHTLFSEGYEKA